MARIASPTVLAYDVGVDSTALLVEPVARGEPPALVLTADTEVEKPATYAYLDVTVQGWPLAAFSSEQVLTPYEAAYLEVAICGGLALASGNGGLLNAVRLMAVETMTT